MKTKIALLIILMSFIFLIGIYTISKNNHKNEDVTRLHVEGIRASYWGMWRLGREFYQLEEVVKNYALNGAESLHDIQDRMDILMVSYEFMLTDKKIFPPLKALLYQHLDSHIMALDQFVQRLTLENYNFQGFMQLNALIDSNKLHYEQAVLQELRGVSLLSFQQEIADKQNMLTYIIYVTFFFILLVLPLWLVTYLYFNKTKKMAQTDHLTQLPNRLYCMTLLKRKLQKQQNLACCFIDLNGFKQINDTHGHQAGDKVLQIIAKKCHGHFNRNDIFARLGGDEFILIVNNFGCENDLHNIVARLITLIEEPITLDQHTLQVGAAIGVAFNSSELNSVDKLFHAADSAMYQAKSHKTALSNCSYFNRMGNTVELIATPA